MGRAPMSDRRPPAGRAVARLTRREVSQKPAIPAGATRPPSTPGRPPAARRRPRARLARRRVGIVQAPPRSSAADEEANVARLSHEVETRHALAASVQLAGDVDRPGGPIPAEQVG